MLLCVTVHKQSESHLQQSLQSQLTSRAWHTRPMRRQRLRALPRVFCALAACVVLIYSVASRVGLASGQPLLLADRAAAGAKHAQRRPASALSVGAAWAPAARSARRAPAGPMRIDPHFGYNRELSDRLPDNRSLPDGRPSSCRRLYGTRAAAVGSPPLLRTAVVIVEWNEATSALRRTVRSVLDRSPRHLLDQIVVVDDASAWEVRHPFLPYVAHPFSSYLRIEFSFWKVSPAIRALPLVSYVRNARREGLMRSRVVGFHHSSAPTVTFLDSHCEVTPGWLPPLLERVTLNQSTVVAPVSLTAPILSTCHSACLPIARERLLPF